MKISFLPTNKAIAKHEIKPIPAIRKIPDWFGQIPTFTDSGKKFRLFANGDINATIKWCNPFLDALSAGYQLLLPFDLLVAKEGENSVFTWKTGGTNFVSTHSKQQISEEMIPAGYNSQPFKFENTWGIKTPAGYSALFQHPVNRTDLPFITLTGLVDTDTYNKPVNFPFVIRDDFEGVIKAGTPIVQIIPVKREKWEHEILEYDQEQTEITEMKFFQHVYRAYKNHYWHRKEYK
jgi:hypothetical protein